MIDTLLASDAFVDRWAFFYDELFQNTAPRHERLGSRGGERVARLLPGLGEVPKPWDDMARR